MTNQLLSPFELGGLKLKNRVVLAPMTRSRAGLERMPNELMVNIMRSGHSMKDWYSFTEEGYTDFPTYQSEAIGASAR